MLMMSDEIVVVTQYEQRNPDAVKQQVYGYTPQGDNSDIDVQPAEARQSFESFSPDAVLSRSDAATVKPKRGPGRPRKKTVDPVAAVAAAVVLVGD
jgi:hypothetical protein